MAALSSLNPTGPNHLIWNSLQMPLGLLATVSSTWATGFLNPGHLNSRTDPFSGRSFTPLPLPAYSGDNSGLERSSSFTVTTKQWLIFGLPEHPKTPLSCISSTLYLLVRAPIIIQSSSPILLALITQSLIPYLVYRSHCSAASPRQQMWNQLLFPSQHRPSGTSTSLPTVRGNRQFHLPFIPSRNS